MDTQYTTSFCVWLQRKQNKVFEHNNDTANRSKRHNSVEVPLKLQDACQSICVSVKRLGESVVWHRSVTQHCQAALWNCDMRLNELCPQRHPFNQTSPATPLLQIPEELDSWIPPRVMSPRKPLQLSLPPSPRNVKHLHNTAWLSLTSVASFHPGLETRFL